MTVGNRTW